MTPFKDDFPTTLFPQLDELGTKSEFTEWSVIESSRTGKSVFIGNDLHALKTALTHWRPSSGNHSFDRAIETARSLAGDNGRIVLVTDRLTTLPLDVTVLALGEPLRNYGFSGAEVFTEDGSLSWSAVVNNYSSAGAKITWTLAAANAANIAKEIELPANGRLTISGRFPANASSVTLNLQTADRFPLDNVLTLLRPESKALALWVDPQLLAKGTLGRLLNSLDSWEFAASAAQADLLIGFQPPEKEILGPPAILFRPTTPGKPIRRRGAVIHEEHPLIKDLSWSGLIAEVSDSASSQPERILLISQEGVPLITLRNHNNSETALINFDPHRSNALSQASFVIFLHRFIERTREAKVAFAAVNFELNEPLNLAVDKLGEPLLLKQLGNGSSSVTAPALAPLLRAPELPGEFEVFQGERLLLKGASHFADFREADFSRATTAGDLRSVSAALIKQNSMETFGSTLSLLLLLAVLLYNWSLLNRGF